MKNKTLAYLIIFLAALAAAVLIVKITQNKDVENSYAYSVIPENPLLLAYINSFEEFAGQIKQKADFLNEQDFTPYNEILDYLGLKVAEPVKNAEELRALLGICPLSPAGIVILEPSQSASMKFFGIYNEAIFKDYLKKSYDLTENTLEGLSYDKLTSKNESMCCNILYIKNSTAFLFENEYTLKKVFMEESNKFCDDETYNEFKKNNPSASAYFYINSKKIGTYLSNILAFAKPSISQQISINIKDKELAAKANVIGDALGVIIDSLIGILKSQNSIMSAVLFDKDGIFLDSDVRLILSDKTSEIFAEKSNENPLITYIPEGAMLISSDNTTVDFNKWKTENLEKICQTIEEKLKMKSSSPESSSKGDECSVFAMYPSSVDNSPFMQLNINKIESERNYLKDKEKKFNDLNALWEKLSFILPVKLHFTMGKTRTFEGAQIQQCKLGILPNKNSLINQILIKIDSNGKENVMVVSSYPFEITEYKDLDVFVGNDNNGKFMNDFLLQLNGKKAKLLVDTESYKFIHSKVYSESSIDIFISISKYFQHMITQISDIKVNGKYLDKTKIPAINPDYNLISLKFNKNGINCRLYFNFYDIRKVFNIIKILDSMTAH